MQIDGVERQLGQNAGEDGGNAEGGVENAGDEAGQHTGDDGGDERHRHGTAVQRQNNAHGAAGAERAVHGQVGHIEDLIGDVNANGHYTPDKTLSGRARHGTEQGRQKLHG